MANNCVLQYDGRKDICPVPLITTKLMLRKLQIGQSLQLFLQDPGSTRDIPNWLTRQNIEFITIDNGEKGIELTITKRDLI